MHLVVSHTSLQPKIDCQGQEVSENADTWSTYLSIPRKLKLSAEVVSCMHPEYVRIVKLHTGRIKLVDAPLKLEI